jgi:putative ABC transport system ATP-binding protein
MSQPAGSAMSAASATSSAPSTANEAATTTTSEGGKVMEAILKAKGLSKRYTLSKDNYVDALREADVEVGRGEMIAIMGPSGSGKSTLLHLLGCLDTADSGTLELQGRRVDNLRNGKVNQIRRNELGFIFQGFNLVPTLTAIENVALAAEYAGHSRKEAIRMAGEALEAVDLADRATHRPNELSGGQQQRAAIARALVNRPVVILGDEPTGNLDSGSSADVISMMREINGATGTTFVLVTHDPDVAAACDRIILMRDGQVVGEQVPVSDQAQATERGHAAMTAKVAGGIPAAVPA